MELYQKIKAFRLRIKLSQEKFSDEIGMSRSNYSHFERGKSQLTTETLLVFANRFNINIDFFTNKNINKENIDGYLDGYVNGYVNENIEDTVNENNKTKNAPLSTNEDTSKHNSTCKFCKEKERVITVMHSQIETLKDQISGLKQQTTDLRNDKIQLKEQYDNLAKDIESRKRNSA